MDNLDFILSFAFTYLSRYNDLSSAIYLQKIQMYATINLTKGKIMKIKLSKEKLEKELKIEEEKKEESKQKKSFFNIFSTVLIILLVIGIIVEIIVIVTLNNRINNLEEEIANIPQIECVYKSPELDIDFNLSKID